MCIAFKVCTFGSYMQCARIITKCSPCCLLQQIIEKHYNALVRRLFNHIDCNIILLPCFKSTQLKLSSNSVRHNLCLVCSWFRLHWSNSYRFCMQSVGQREPQLSSLKHFQLYIISHTHKTYLGKMNNMKLELVF